MLARVALVLFGLMAVPAAALAADGDARSVSNVYSVMLERQLFSWHIWTTGVSRLDDGTLFGFASIILALAFAASGIGIILFQQKGVGFRAGWLISLPTIIVAMIVFTKFRPYPSVQDVPSMLVAAVFASIFVLFIARLTKVSATHAVEHTEKKEDRDKAIHDRRLKMAVRAPGGGGKRAF
ncbi:MAG: hypothetical protein KDJ25_12340 [Rhodoblastus sp.]|nr:hypothetical protein [Rhodoblastus sp.]